MKVFFTSCKGKPMKVERFFTWEDIAKELNLRDTERWNKIVEGYKPTYKPVMIDGRAMIAEADKDRIISELNERKTIVAGREALARRAQLEASNLIHISAV